MEGLLLNYSFFIVFITPLFIVLLRLCIKRQKEKLKKVVVVFYLLIMAIGVYMAIGDTIKYYSFNNLSENDIDVITVNGKAIALEKKNLLLTELKDDEFTWVNHPIITENYEIMVYTKKEDFKFRITNTSNQGVLVRRISGHKEYVINRNDRIISIIK